MLIKSLVHGLKRNWATVPGSMLKVWGLVWLITASGSYFFPWAKTFAEQNSLSVVGVSSAMAILYGVYAARDLLEVAIDIKTTNTKVVVKFGDLFDSLGHVVIPVNDFFDSEIGKPVGPQSVHGQFIQRTLGGNASKFNSDVDRYLNGSEFEVVERPIGRERRYPLGTTAVLTEGSRKYFLFALAKSDPITCVASADVPQMWAALQGLWRTVREEANGEGVRIPLVGGGLARLNFDYSHLLRLSLLTILAETRQAPFAKNIEIVLHQTLVGKINLRAVAADWR